MNQEEFYTAKLRYEMDSWDLSEALKQNQNTVVVDTRKPEAFTKEHIPGAVNIPHRIMNKETTELLDSAKIYVTYCDGIGCNASTKGARNLLRLGFTVKELLGGLDWWKRDGYPTQGTKGSEKTLVSCSC